MSENHVTNLVSKMEEYRQQQIGTDIVIECGGGNIHAHKFVLKLSCLYFNNMFNTNMTENNEGRVNFSYIKREVVETVVKYLYTGQFTTLTTDFELLEQLMEMGRMMDCRNLLTDCWKQMISNLKVEEFAKFWCLGVDYGLEKQIEDFVKINFKKISMIANLKCLTKTHMIKLFECANEPRFCNDCIYCLLSWLTDNDVSEEIATELFKKIDLQHSTDELLCDLLIYNCNEKRNAIECIAVREISERLTKRSKMCEAITKVVNVNYQKKCKSYPFSNSASSEDSVWECEAERALKDIKSVCDKNNH